MSRALSVLMIGVGLVGCTRLPSLGCIFKGDGCRADGDSGETAEVPGWVSTFVPQLGTSLPPTLRRVTPEQLTWSFDAAVKDECRVVKVGFQSKICSFKDYLAVPLGGVDFALTRERDENVKINTLAFAREEMDDKSLYLASQNRSVDPSDGYYDETNFWSEADPANDDHKPAAAGAVETEGSRKWRAQLDKTYWMFLSRPPTEGEVSTMTNLFLAAEADGSMGWHEVLYVLFMSEEFWHI